MTARRAPGLVVGALLGALAVALPAAAPAAPAPGDRVAVFLTTRDLHTTLERQGDRTLDAGAPTTGETITVDPSTTGQTLTAGFGVAMTDTSAKLLQDELPAGRRDEVMRRLFSVRHGIGLSFLRLPIGGSDYVVGRPYSYDDQPPGGSDPALKDFSIAHDRPYLLPMIRRALALHPGMTVMANPWTPPAWMKTDDQLVTATGPAGQLSPLYYGAYADYLVRFLQAYKAEGVPVDYLGVQNEPLTPLLLVAGIPESFLDPAAEGALIGQFVAPALRRAGLKPGIVAYDDGYERSEAYIPVVMGLAGADVAGFAYHCYFSDPASIGVEAALFPGKVQLETECSSKLSNVDPQQMTVRALRAGAQGVQLWNAALDQHGGPKIGNGCKGIVGPYAGQDCIAPVTVDTATHTTSFTADFWALAHFSRFIRPGARRIASTSPSNCPTSPAGGDVCGLEDVAFQNPDGSRVLVATAHDGRAHPFTVSVGSRRFGFTVPDGGTVTFVWNDPAPVVSAVAVPSRVRARRAARMSFALSEDAAVTVTVQRRRRTGGWAGVRRLERDGVRGDNVLALPRQDGRHRPLRPGRYRVAITAVDTTGTGSAVTRRAFRIL